MEHAKETEKEKDALEINNNTSADSNRRCSSVPRTLKEKQAVARQATIGEKIQSFFSSSSSSNGSASTNNNTSVKAKSRFNFFKEIKKFKFF